MKFNAAYWIKFSLVNLLIVAFLGSLMRYKIGFDFPFLTQKNIQHAHSHFAFAGWVTHSIYVLMIYFIANNLLNNNLKHYTKLLILNLLFSYGMLISFFVSGYSFVSIALSTLTIVNNCFFAYFFFKDFKKIETYNPSVAWFKAALWFNLVSSIGTFYLGYMMASKNFNEHGYLASIYYYLHFQYNGFFTFACIGFLLNKLPKFLPTYKYNKNIFILLAFSCVPAYFLSILWAKLPMWVYIIVVIAAFAQVLAWYLLARDIWRASKQQNNFSTFSKYIFLFVAIAFTIKLLLQLGSTIPELSKLAFGFRPVVIAYLHLVLLAVISAFLLGYFFTTELIQTHKKSIIALTIFLVGILLNELALGAQGIAGFSYFPLKHMNETLFFISLVLLIGAIMIVVSSRHKKNTQQII